MITLDLMWEKFAEHQPEADRLGYGEVWRKMCDERTEDAAADAAWAPVTPIEAALAAWSAADAEALAAVDAARAERWAKYAIAYIEKAEAHK